MSDESKVTREDIMEQMQAGHRARIDGTMLQNLNKDSVQFHEVMPNRGPYQQAVQPQAAQQTAKQPQQDQAVPESYLNYAAQLLEQMRGVYASSWDNCSCGSSPAWHGGHNHFYDPCSGVDTTSDNSCPNYEHHNSCCNDGYYAAKPPRPPMNDCGTTTFYDDCAYKLQKMSDQLTRIETMTQDMYAVNQQLATYIIEYYNKFISNHTTASNNNC